MATVLLSLAFNVITASAAFATGVPPYVPTSVGQRSEAAQASGDWVLAIAFLVAVSATSVLLLGWMRVRHHSSRGGQASPVADSTP